MKTIIFLGHTKVNESVGRVTKYTVYLKNGGIITNTIVGDTGCIPFPFETVESIRFTTGGIEDYKDPDTIHLDKEKNMEPIKDLMPFAESWEATKKELKRLKVISYIVEVDRMELEIKNGVFYITPEFEVTVQNMLQENANEQDN